MSPRPVIVTEHLTKSFVVSRRRPGVLGGIRSLVAPARSSLTAVSDVSFTIQEGELVALLGPNGAGKSTTVKMVTGILVPTSGRVEVAGLVPHRDRRRNAYHVGVVFGQRSQLWWDLPGRESLKILQAMFEIEDRVYTRRLGEFDQMLELSSFWDTPVRHLSLGQRMRLDLAASLLHDPPIIVLDEPTVGMDVVAKEQVREFLRDRVARDGRTVLLTTHDMTEVKHLAERVLLINHSRLVFDGPLTELRDRFGSTWRIDVTLAEPMATLPHVDGLHVTSRDGVHVRFVAADGHPSPLRDFLQKIIASYPVATFAVDEDDIEHIVRRAYERQTDPTTAPQVRG